MALNKENANIKKDKIVDSAADDYMSKELLESIS